MDLQSSQEAGGNAAPAELRRALSDAVGRIRELEQRLEREARERAELIHLVSHELRTPITVVAGFTRLLQSEAQGGLNAEQHRFVAEGLKACRRLDQLVGDLLDAQLEGEAAFEIVRADNDLHETIEAQLESVAPLLEARGLKVEASLRSEDPVFAFDARRVEQVITNLVSNAIRHGQPSSLVRIETRDQSDGNVEGTATSVEVAVEDGGPGIREADRERLFDPYVRGEGSDAAGGLGIGLAICRRIIEAHGGRIDVESGELGGARFVFSLPRMQCAHGED